MELNKITERIIGCAIEVHRYLGPGLLESIYESASSRRDPFGIETPMGLSG